jgi:hypothetical protein
MKSITPAVFGSTESPALLARGVAPRPTPIPVLTSAEQAARTTRLILVLGGGAFGLAVLLSLLAVFIWRLRRH